MGGAVTADFGLDAELVKRGHEVEVLTTNAGLASCYKNKTFASVRVSYFSYMGPVNFSISPGVVFKLLKKLWDIRRSATDYRVFYSGIWNLPCLIGPSLCRFFGVQYVITPHGTLYPELLNEKKQRLKSFLIKHIVRRNLAGANFVHCTVLSEKVAVDKLCGSNVCTEIIPLGLEIGKDSASEISHFNINKFERTVENILFVGRVNWKKGLPVLLEALALMKRDEKKVKLSIVGPIDEGYDDTLRKVAQSFGLIEGGDFEFLGEKYGAELTSLYKQADIFALTSISENFGMTILEAAYNGTPIVMTEGVGASQFFSNLESAVIVPYCAKAVFEGLTRLSEDQTLREKVATKAALIANNMTVEKMTSDFCSVLEKSTC